MDEVTGMGSAGLQDDGALQIEFEDRNGGEAVLKAIREPFQQPVEDVEQPLGYLTSEERGV